MGPNVINFNCDLTPIIKPYSSSFMPGDYTQLLDEVFVISRIINVEVGVISRSRRLRPITLTESLSSTIFSMSCSVIDSEANLEV